MPSRSITKAKTVKKPKARSKKAKDKFPGLDKDQRKFIKAKIKDLKTMEEVEKFYRLDDNVTKFAIIEAKKIYKKSKKDTKEAK